MGLERGREKLTQAVRILAEEKGRVKDRLLIAYASQLCLVNIRDDMPKDLFAPFTNLHNALSDADMPYGRGERAAQKIDALTEDEAAARAADIFQLFLKIQSAPPEPHSR